MRRGELLSGNRFPEAFGDSEENLPDGEVQSRREFLRTVTLSAAGLLAGLTASSGLESPEAHARALELVPFQDEAVAPVQTLIGGELDGRLFTDLASVSAERLVTPTSSFFVRTAASRLLPRPDGWRVRVEGGSNADLSIGSLRAASRSIGTHLIECAGNVRLTRFGLISVAEWAGMPITQVLERAGFRSKPSWIEISGFDEYASPATTSVPGASWIFAVDHLENAGAFLAVEMNGGPLTRDHGAPVRLVVPGWYGCCCIKWVNKIRVVEEDAEATSQMREYAVRTLQPGRPTLARDFEPATVDHAALPIRVEKLRNAGRAHYRVVGIAWGGSEPVRKLTIRFNPEEEFLPVEAFNQVKTDPWTVWSHTWAPRTAGLYTIRLAVADPRVRARKLEMGLYDRSVEIRDL